MVVEHKEKSSSYLIQRRHTVALIQKIGFFHGMLLHYSVAMETYFGQLKLYLENRDS